MTTEQPQWGPGPWDNEPNRIEFEAAGLRCIMLRHMRFGHWCGYVRVGDDHPWNGMCYSDRIEKPPADLVHRPVNMDSVGVINFFIAALEGVDLEQQCTLSMLIDAHGGLTWAGSGPEDGADGWWFGFDCNHCNDLSPGMEAIMSKFNFPIMGDRVYRDAAYVRSITESVARQLASVQIREQAHE